MEGDYLRKSQDNLEKLQVENTLQGQIIKAIKLPPSKLKISKTKKPHQGLIQLSNIHS